MNLLKIFILSIILIPGVASADPGHSSPEKSVGVISTTDISVEVEGVSAVKVDSVDASKQEQDESSRELLSPDMGALEREEKVISDNPEIFSEEDSEKDDLKKEDDMDKMDDMDEKSSFLDVFLEMEDDDAKQSAKDFVDADESDKEKVEGEKTKEIVIVGSKIKEMMEDKKVEVRGWDSKKKEVIMKTEDIKNRKDLVDFVGVTVLSDNGIEKVSMDEDKMEIEYKKPSRLFGFIPMSLTAKVVLDEKNKVKVKLPWYAFLVKSELKESKDDIDVLSLAWGASKGAVSPSQDKAEKLKLIIESLQKTSNQTASNSIRNMR